MFAAVVMVTADNSISEQDPTPDMGMLLLHPFVQLTLAFPTARGYQIYSVVEPFHVYTLNRGVVVGHCLNMNPGLSDGLSRLSYCT